MIRSVYIPAPEPVSVAQLVRKAFIALAVYAAFFVGFCAVGIASLIEWSA